MVQNINPMLDPIREQKKAHEFRQKLKKEKLFNEKEAIKESGRSISIIGVFILFFGIVRIVNTNGIIGWVLLGVGTLVIILGLIRQSTKQCHTV